MDARLAIVLLAFGVSACTANLSTDTSSPPPTCNRANTLSRADYDKLFGNYIFDSDFKKLSPSEQKAEIENAQKRVNFLTNGTRVCIREKNSTSIVVWSDTYPVIERARLERMKDTVAEGNSSRTSSFDVPGTFSPPPQPAPSYVTPPQAAEKRAPVGNGTSTYLRQQISEAGRLGQIKVKVDSAEYSGKTELDNSALLVRIAEFYEKQPLVQDELAKVLDQYVKGFTTKEARISRASDEPRFAHVLSYFKNAYGEDLSQTVVISAPLANIPHVGGSTVAHALGLHIAIVEVPTAMRFRLPLNKIDSTASEGAYAIGTLQVTMNNQLEIQREALRQTYGSDRIIHLDLDYIGRTVLPNEAFEGVVAHELRHLLDSSRCPALGKELCDPDHLVTDQNKVVAEANTQMRSYYDKFLAHPRTQNSRKEISAVLQMYRPAQSESQREAALDDILLNFFNANYSRYSLLYSVKERRGYKEQLSYLISRGQTRSQAVTAMVRTLLPERQEERIDGKTVRVPTPGVPWAEALFNQLADEQKSN